MVQNSEVAIIVSSYDGMADLWGPFWGLFAKYWPDCPYQKYVISNSKVCTEPGVSTIAVGPDLGWAKNLSVALEKLNHRYVIYLQEDYLISGPVNEERLAQLINNADAIAADLTYIFPRYKLETSGAQISDDLKEIPAGSLYRVNLQAAVWRVDYFKAQLRPDESQWKFEIRASEQASGRIFVDASAVAGKVGTWIIPYFVTGIVRGKWVPGALALCRRNGIRVDKNARGVHWYWPIRVWAAKIKWFVRNKGRAA